MKKPKFIEKECKYHGITKFSLEKRDYYRCKKCRSEAVIESRKKLRTATVYYKGGKCEICGYNKCQSALEFHHKDPTKKEFELGKIIRSKKTFFEEADKCHLLCANCHREVHAGIHDGYIL